MTLSKNVVGRVRQAVRDEAGESKGQGHEASWLSS